MSIIKLKIRKLFGGKRNYIKYGQGYKKSAKSMRELNTRGWAIQFFANEVTVVPFYHTLWLTFYESYPPKDANSKNCTGSNFYFHDHVHSKNVRFQSTRRQARTNFAFHKTKSF